MVAIFILNEGVNHGNSKKIIPIPELVKQVKDLKKHLYYHLAIEKPEVRREDIDDIVTLKNELQNSEKLALDVFGHIFENGIYK